MSFFRMFSSSAPKKAATASGAHEDLEKIFRFEYTDGQESEELDKSGSVKLTYDNGDSYEGDIEVDSTRVFKHGTGTYSWSNGAEYTGDYVKGVKQGQGKYVTADGEQYLGDFSSNMKHGKGYYVHNNGDFFSGKWKNDERHGQGVTAFADGSSEAANWKNGKVVELTKRQPTPVPVKGLALIISGPPASGKGTQCSNIIDTFGVVHLSTGNMLRAAVADGSPVGLKAKHFMDNGLLVPDEVVLNVIEERLAKNDIKEKGFILDGYPRTGIQAQALKTLGINIDGFVLLDVPDEVLRDRVAGRLYDPDTGNTYTQKQAAELEDSIKGRLVKRADDTSEKVMKRIDDFNTHIPAIRAQFEDYLVKVNGDQTPAEVWEQIDQALQKIKEEK